MKRTHLGVKPPQKAPAGYAWIQVTPAVWKLKPVNKA